MVKLVREKESFLCLNIYSCVALGKDHGKTKAKSVSRSARAGLQFPVGKFFVLREIFFNLISMNKVVFIVI